MIRCLLLLFFLIISYSGIGQALGFTLAAGQKKVEIPIQVYNNLVVVQVVLNDALPLKFVVDTGVRTAILTQKAFSDILQLPYSRKYTISGPGGEKMIDAYVTNNVSLRLPGITGRGHALLVLEEDYLEMRNFLGVDVHGILGYELFSRFIVEINYAKKTMTLYSPERFKPRRKFKSMPMRIEDTKPYIITPVILNAETSISAKLLMDTGASHGLMLEPTSDDRIQVPPKTVSSVIGRGIGGAITGKVGRINCLQLTDFELDNVLVNFPDPNSYLDTLKSTSVFRNGSIGGEIMSRFKIVFDYPRERLYLKKTSDFKKPFYYNLSGVNVKAIGARLDAFEVTEVRKKSAGEEGGILAGDKIITINNIEAKLLHLNNINAILNSKPGKKVRLEIMRKGERLKKIIVLRDQI